ncbi:MAG: response regulator transcription factor [Marmoricola sp.]
MFAAFADRVEVVEISAGPPLRMSADIAVLDTFSADTWDAAARLGEARADKFVIYTWKIDATLTTDWLAAGVHGILAKSLTALELVGALERIHAGDIVVSANGGQHGRRPPGRGLARSPGGLSARESEIIALITQGLSNQEIADRAFLSINTVKSYIRSSYRKMDVTSRSRAVLWGLENGFRLQRVQARSIDVEL